VGDVRAHPIRHHGGEVSGKLETRAAAVPWRRKNSEHKGRAQERKNRWKAKSRTNARRAVLNGTGLTLHLRRRARRVSETFAPRARPPAEQPPATATPQFPRDADLHSLCAVMMERSRLSRLPRCPRP
jgi:hypothetical protein